MEPSKTTEGGGAAGSTGSAPLRPSVLSTHAAPPHSANPTHHPTPRLPPRTPKQCQAHIASSKPRRIPFRLAYYLGMSQPKRRMYSSELKTLHQRIASAELEALVERALHDRRLESFFDAARLSEDDTHRHLELYGEHLTWAPDLLRADLAWALLLCAPATWGGVQRRRQETEHLTIAHSHESLAHLDRFENLRKLRVMNLELERLVLGRLRGLQKLEVHRLPLLHLELPESLLELQLHDCQRLTALSGSSFGALKHFEAINCTSLQDITRLKTAESLELASFIGCAALEEASALEGLDALKVVALNGTLVQRRSVPKALLSVSTWARKPSFKKLLRGLPMRERGQQSALDTPAKHKLTKLKRLLTSKDLDAINQGLALLDLTAEPSWFDTLLEDLQFEEAKDRRGPVLRGLTSSRYSGPFQNYVMLALLCKAPEHCEKAKMLRQRIDRLYFRTPPRNRRSPQVLNPAYLSGLAGLVALELDAVTLIDGQPPPQLKGLQGVSCSNLQLKELGWLKGAPSLRFLRLERCEVEDASALESLGLEDLELYSTKIDHPRLFHAAQKLTAASPMRSPPPLIDRPIASLKLRDLSLERFKIASMAVFDGLSSLEHLSLRSVQVARQVPEKRVELPALKRLILDETSLQHISCLSNATELDELLLIRGETRLSEALRGQLKLPRLRELRIWKHWIQSARFFEPAIGLERLTLENVRFVEPFDGAELLALPNLKTVRLTYCERIDPEPFRDRGIEIFQSGISPSS